MKKAIYPGSFDPITNGHLDLIIRAAKLFDELHIVVSNNIFKKSNFTIEDKIEMIKTVTKNINNIKVVAYDGLVVNYCKDNNINIIVRGLRNFSDFENEFSLYHYNKDIYNKIETIFLMPSTKNQVVSSSAIKELITFNVDISKYVPKEIKDFILYKIKL